MKTRARHEAEAPVRVPAGRGARVVCRWLSARCPPRAGSLLHWVRAIRTAAWRGVLTRRSHPILCLHMHQQPLRSRLPGRADPKAPGSAKTDSWHDHCCQTLTRGCRGSHTHGSESGVVVMAATFRLRVNSWRWTPESVPRPKQEVSSGACWGRPASHAS